MSLYNNPTLLLLLFNVLIKSLLCFSPATGAAVKHLPGFEGPLPFELETGYIGVGEAEEAQLFYYFIKSESNSIGDPLIFWLTGGPGCSGLWSILFDNGPLQFNRVEYNGSMPTMSSNPYRWTKIANIVFLDLPVGAGFSYATTRRAIHSDDIQTGAHGCEFVQKWVKKHPEFISNDVYVGGESYAGIHVPIITRCLSYGIESRVTPWINLKGYLLGNPFESQYKGFNYQVPFAHGMGLISDDFYKLLEGHCGGEYQDFNPNNLLCLQNLATFYQWYGKLHRSHILEPACDERVPKKHDCYKNGKYPKYPQSLFLQRRSLQHIITNNNHFPLQPKSKCRDIWYNLMEIWANEQIVQDALHIRKGSIDKWKSGSSSVNYTKNVDTVMPYHLYLSNKGYRSLIYSGDHDPCQPFLSTQAWIKSLNYSVVDDWRPWLIDDQIAGYTMTYSNGMTFATVKGGGHTVPEYAPYQAQIMFIKWLQNGTL